MKAVQQWIFLMEQINRIMKNILITSAGKRVALIKSFKEAASKFANGSKIYTTDMNPSMAPAAYISDKGFAVPRVTDESYPSVLLQMCIKNNIGMIVPTIDTELLVLAKNRKIFEAENVKVIVSSFPFVSVCRDKRETGKFLTEHGIRVPMTIDKYHPAFPMFAKPYDGSLSTNIHYISSANDLTPDILNDGKLIFMEYIDKKFYKEYTVDMYYGADNHVKCIIPRERIEIRAGEINKGRTAKNYIVDFLKQRLNYIEGCIGCICIQLFYNPVSSDIIGIEINPRFGGGYPLSYMAGGDYPSYLIREYFMQEDLTYTNSWRDNVLMLRFDDAVYV